MNDPRGVVKCKQYGDSYLVLKDCRLRCTFSPEDSANLKADRLAVLDFYGHVLAGYDDQELVETIKVATQTDAALLGDSEKARRGGKWPATARNGLVFDGFEAFKRLFERFRWAT